MAETRYIKPKPEYAAAKAEGWKRKAPAGSDPADIDAIATAFATGEIREQYADHLVARSGTTELPDAIEALKRAPSAGAFAPVRASPQAAAAAGRTTAYDKLFSPAALERMRGGPPKTEMSEADYEALRAQMRQSRAARRPLR